MDFFFKLQTILMSVLGMLSINDNCMQNEQLTHVKMITFRN